jgi:hypothetical protein
MNTQSTTGTQPNAPKRFTCRHIFHDGHRCGSPALRGDRTFCFYHRSTPRPNPPLPSIDPEVKFAGPSFAELLLPLPEDRAAIQTCIGMVMRAIGSAKIDIRRANALLYSLQLAALNLPPHPRPSADRSPSSGSRSSSTDEQRRTGNEQRLSSNLGPVVDDLEDSDLGPLAPVLEYGLPEPEEECEPSLASIINTYLNSPPPPPPVELDKRPYDFDTLQLLRRTLATTTNPETATRIRKALEEEALLPGHNLHIQACAEEPTTGKASESGASAGAPGLAPETWDSGSPIHGSLTAMSGGSTSDPEEPTHPRVQVPQVSPLRPGNPTPTLPAEIENPPQDPAHLQRRCRAIRRAFLPRSARPLPPNLPKSSDFPPCFLRPAKTMGGTPSTSPAHRRPLRTHIPQPKTDTQKHPSPLPPTGAIPSSSQIRRPQSPQTLPHLF